MPIKARVHRQGRQAPGVTSKCGNSLGAEPYLPSMATIRVQLSSPWTVDLTTKHVSEDEGRYFAIDVRTRDSVFEVPKDAFLNGQLSEVLAT